jgi:hypothetical protein
MLLVFSKYPHPEEKRTNTFQEVLFFPKRKCKAFRRKKTFCIKEFLTLFNQRRISYAFAEANPLFFRNYACMDFSDFFPDSKNIRGPNSDGGFNLSEAELHKPHRGKKDSLARGALR